MEVKVVVEENQIKNGGIKSDKKVGVKKSEKSGGKSVGGGEGGLTLPLIFLYL